MHGVWANEAQTLISTMNEAASDASKNLHIALLAPLKTAAEKVQECATQLNIKDSQLKQRKLLRCIHEKYKICHACIGASFMLDDHIMPCSDTPRGSGPRAFRSYFKFDCLHILNVTKIRTCCCNGYDRYIFFAGVGSGGTGNSHPSPP